MKKILLLSALLLCLTIIFTCCASGSSETETKEQSDNTNAPSSSVVTRPLITAYDNPSLYVSLPEFSQININNSEVDKLVNEQLSLILSALGQTEYVQVHSPAIMGDSVNINYTGRPADPSVELSQESIDGMSNADDEEGFDLVLGSGKFIPGFEEQLVGASENETVSIEVTFPESYTDELKGLDVIFDVTINSVSRVTVDERSYLSLSVIYSLDDPSQQTGELSDFMEMKTIEFDISNEDAVFDTYFDSAAVRVALLGKNMYGTASVELTLTEEQAEKFGCDAAVKLKAMITIDNIVTMPQELTDEIVNEYTNGEYKTKEAFEKYIKDYCMQLAAYTKVSELAEFGEMASDAYEYLYNAYYSDALYQILGDTSSMTQEEIDEMLTEDVKKQAQEYADSNAIAEYRDRMIMALLCERLDFELDQQTYESKLKELFDYYESNYYIYLLYNGISTIEDFETFFGYEYLEFQFISEEIMPLLVNAINYVN